MRFLHVQQTEMREDKGGIGDSNGAAKVVLDIGSPLVNFTLSLPISACTRTHASRVRVSAGFALGMDMVKIGHITFQS